MAGWVRIGLAACFFLVCMSAVVESGGNGAGQHDGNLVRIAVSPSSWLGVRQNDAAAAIKAWARTILGECGIAAEVDARFFENSQDMIASLSKCQVDAMSMVTDELLVLDLKMRPDSVFISVKNKSFTERYVILVHRNSGIEDVPDLAGRSVLLHRSSRMCLAPQWLETLLETRSAALADQVLRNMSSIENASRAVLQVFFHKADASVVTANVFEMMSELNPQVHKELRVLASSPEVVPNIFFFRSGYTSPVRDRLEAALEAIHNSPAGRQILTVFQCDSMVKRPISILEGTNRMLAEYERLRRHGGIRDDRGPLTKVAQ